MMNKAVNMIKMITLIQANPSISAQEIMRECDLQERTFYRYMRDIGLAGINIAYDPDIQGYRYQSHFDILPLDLSADEARAFSWHCQASSADRRENPALDSGLTKILASLSRDESNKSILEGVRDSFRLGTSYLDSSSQDRESGENNQNHNKHIEEILQAIIENRVLETSYLTQSREEVTQRRLRPFYLLPRNNNFYLIAHCQLRDDYRIFRLSRFIDIRKTSDKFNREDYSFSLDQYLANTWSIEPGTEEINFKVRFSPAIARYMREEAYLVPPTITDNPDGSINFQVTVNSEREFLQWLNQYGPDAEILEPIEYRERQRDKLKEWLEIYEENEVAREEIIKNVY